jgi:hypothetical protein
MNSRRVEWLWPTEVYHLPGKAQHRKGQTYVYSRCGVLLGHPMRAFMDGTEHSARRLGLRLCQRCSAAL